MPTIVPVTPCTPEEGLSTSLPCARFDIVLLSALIVLFVKVSVVALPTRVSVALGIVIVLLAVGLVTVKVVSYASSAEPSKIIDESDKYRLDIVGLVIVLFVKVCVPSVDTTVIPSN